MVKYAGASRGHSLWQVDVTNGIVVLEDGSRWKVYEGFVDILRTWQAEEMVTIKPNRDPLFPYKVVNIHKNQSVEAQYLPG